MTAADTLAEKDRVRGLSVMVPLSLEDLTKHCVALSKKLNWFFSSFLPRLRDDPSVCSRLNTSPLYANREGSSKCETTGLFCPTRL